MSQDTVRLGYVPREQFIPFHKRDKRWSIIVAHRRAGKTVACVVDLIDAALRCKKERPRFAYCAPLYKQAKQVSWDYLKRYGLRVPGAVASESELRVDFPHNGSQVRLYGADNPDSLRGIYLDGCILDEAADMSPSVYQEVLRPALSDRQGWCTWIGTPRGENDFYDLWQTAHKPEHIEDWFRLMLKASETGVLPLHELDDARKQMGPDRYNQEYECSFRAALYGAYYGKEMEQAESDGRVGRNIYDPTLQVQTAWDLGGSDQTVIWFYQGSSFEIRVIDLYSANGYGLDHYVSVLQDRAARPGNEKGYKYGRHHFPHDVGNIDLGTGRTRLETLRGLGVYNVHVVPKLGIDEGINAVRRILPRCWFERDKCEIGLKALRQYRREYDDIRKTFYEKPLHDWCSDYADAFRTLAVGLNEASMRKNKPLPKRGNGWIY